jgi:sec-independent protein translocase protein TatA
MGDLFQPTHLIILAIVVLVLFGGKKLPELGKGLGEGLKGFREGMRGFNDPPPPVQNAQQNAAPAQPVTPPVEPKQS